MPTTSLPALDPVPALAEGAHISLHAMAEVGFIEVFPPRANASRPPVLLATLDAQLLSAKGAASRLASAGPHQQRGKPDPQLAANLSLDVHRQVFQSFIDGFGEAYHPLLGEIKASFDAAIAAGLRYALDNSEAQLQLLAAERETRRQVAAVRAEVLESGQQQREQLYHAIAAAQARLGAGQRKLDLAANDLAQAKGDLERLRAAAKGARATKQRLADAAAAEANWLAARPHAAALLAMTAGPLTPQEDEELEAEMGVALDGSAVAASKHPLERALALLEKHDTQAAAALLEQHVSGAGTSRRRQVLAASLAGEQQQQPEVQQLAGSEEDVADDGTLSGQASATDAAT